MSRRRTPLVTLLAGLAPLAFSWSPARAASSGGEGARLERLADGVYAILHDDAILQWPSGATGWPHGNTGVVIGDDGVLVVDSTFLPSRARADIDLIRSLTDKPVRYLVNTHWHMDHTSGNAVYKEAFPQLRIVSQRETARVIAFWDARWPRFETAPDSSTRKELKQLEELLSKGQDAEGRPLDDKGRARLSLIVGQMRNELQELSGLRSVPADLLFDEEMSLNLGRRRVELRNRGRANSPADVTVYLPEEKVLFTGDVLVHPVPYAMGSYPLAWIEVLRALEAMPISALVPGHGPVMRDHAYTRQVRELLEATAARVEAQAVQGNTLDQIKKTVDLLDQRGRFVKAEEATAAFYWDYSIKDALVERAFRCLSGAQC